MKRFLLAAVLSIFVLSINAQTAIKVLFDARKAQMAGNADWVVDADQFNLGVGSGGAMVTGAGNEANPQRIPTPAQSGITSSTSETYWKGGNSAWGVDLAKLGYVIETLPYNGSITYGVTTNPQDLANYKVFICNEPNIRFTAAEKTAIISFVQNGGGLFMVADHTVSDRNNDTWDSPAIWNDLMTNNSIANNPFGISFDLANFSQTTTNFANLPANTILHGTLGNPTSMKFSNGTSITINKTINANALGLVYKTGLSTTGSTGIMMACSKYGTGKVVGLGDSSPPDDGTGDLNDVLYNGWTGEVSGNHRRIILNACVWLSNTAAQKLANDEISNAPVSFMNVFPNPTAGKLTVAYSADGNTETTITVYDIVGNKMLSVATTANDGINNYDLDLSNLADGSYLVELSNSSSRIVKRFVKGIN